MHFSNTDVPEGFGLFGAEDNSETNIGLNTLGGLSYHTSENVVVGGEFKLILSDLNDFKIQGGVTYLIPR